MARRIDGFNWEDVPELDEIEYELGRDLTKEEEQEVGILLNWNYCIDDCIEMLRIGLTAEEYESSLE